MARLFKPVTAQSASQLEGKAHAAATFSRLIKELKPLPIVLNRDANDAMMPSAARTKTRKEMLKWSA